MSVCLCAIIAPRLSGAVRKTQLPPRLTFCHAMPGGGHGDVNADGNQVRGFELCAGSDNDANSQQQRAACCSSCSSGATRTLALCALMFVLGCCASTILRNSSGATSTRHMRSSTPLRVTVPPAAEMSIETSAIQAADSPHGMQVNDRLAFA